MLGAVMHSKKWKTGSAGGDIEPMVLFSYPAADTAL